MSITVSFTTSIAVSSTIVRTHRVDAHLTQLAYLTMVYVVTYLTMVYYSSILNGPVARSILNEAYPSV
jgi:hypothetical protein